MTAAAPSGRGTQQQRVYDWICCYHRSFGRSPSYRESALALGIKYHSTVQHHIKRLCASGKLRWAPNNRRAFEFLHPDGTWHPTPPPK